MPQSKQLVNIGAIKRTLADVEKGQYQLRRKLQVHNEAKERNQVQRLIFTINS